VAALVGIAVVVGTVVRNLVAVADTEVARVRTVADQRRVAPGMHRVRRVVPEFAQALSRCKSRTKYRFVALLMPLSFNGNTGAHTVTVLRRHRIANTDCSWHWCAGCLLLLSVTLLLVSAAVTLVAPLLRLLLVSVVVVIVWHIMQSDVVLSCVVCCCLRKSE
jgi:hypothetical protein